MPGVDELEEEHGAVLVDRQVADLVDHQQSRMGEHAQPPGQIAGGLGLGEGLDQPRERAVVDAPAGLGRRDREASDIGSGPLVGSHSAHDDHVQGGVGLAVASAVETVALRLPTRCGDRADAAHHGEARLGAEPIRVIPNGDHYCACVLGAHAFELKQTGGELLDQGDDEPVEFSDLVVDVEDSAGEGSPC